MFLRQIGSHVYPSQYSWKKHQLGISRYILVILFLCSFSIQKWFIFELKYLFSILESCQMYHLLIVIFQVKYLSQLSIEEKISSNAVSDALKESEEMESDLIPAVYEGIF